MRKINKTKMRCSICNKVFYVFPYEIKRGRKYCGRKCYGKVKYTHRTVDPRGYILIFAPYHPYAKGKGYVYEHRLVMEKHLGRFLKPNECIHHLDGNPSNNNIKNLKLTNKSEHKKLHPSVGKETRFTSKSMYEYWRNVKRNKAHEKEEWL